MSSSIRGRWHARTRFSSLTVFIPQSSLSDRQKRGLISGAAFGYSQGITFWVFAIMFYVGAIMVDNGQVKYENFFTSMFAVIFGAFGVGQVRATIF